MEGLIRYFVKYNLVGDLLMVALLASGWVGLGSMKSIFFTSAEVSDELLISPSSMLTTSERPVQLTGQEDGETSGGDEER